MNPPPLQTETQLPKPRNPPNLSQSQGGGAGHMTRQTYGKWRRTLVRGSGRLVPAWEFLAKNWQKAWPPDGGASRRRHVPKLPSEGRHSATCKSGKGVEQRSWKSGKSREAVATRCALLTAIGPFTPPHQSLAKIESWAKCYIYVTPRLLQKLEKSVIAQETKRKILFCATNLPIDNQTWGVMICVHIILLL